MAHFLRLLRLAKLGRYALSVRILELAFRRSWQEIAVGLGLALTVLFLGAVSLHILEREAQPESFGSVPRALWWSVATLTTVGYGDVYPITTLGRLAAAVVAILGIGTVALPAGILSAAFIEAYREVRQEGNAEADHKAEAARESGGGEG